MSRLVCAVLAAALAGPVMAADPGGDAAGSYRLETAGSTRALAVGRAGKLVLSIDPLQPGIHIDPRAPLKITLEASPGLALAKVKLGHADAVDPKAAGRRFEIPVTGKLAGKQEARAALDFFVCSDTWCVKQSRRVTFPIDVR